MSSSSAPSCDSLEFERLGSLGGPPSYAPQTDWSNCVTEPVIMPLSSEARNATAFATSSGASSRPKGSSAAAFSIQPGSAL